MSNSGKKVHWLLWLVVGCIGLIVWVVAHQFIPPANELDKLVYAMRETQRVGLAIHLLRIAIFIAVLLLGWSTIVGVIHRKLGITKEVALTAKWRVFGWYLAFEAVLMINFIG